LRRETPIAATVSPITEYVANALAASATSAIAGLLLCAVAACASKHVMNDAANEPIFTPAFFNDEEDEEEVDDDDDDDDDEAGAYSSTSKFATDDDSFANAKTGPTRRLHALLFFFFFALKTLLMIFFCCFCALVVVVWWCEESNTKPDEVDIFLVLVSSRDINKNEGKKIRRRDRGGEKEQKEEKKIHGRRVIKY